MNKLLVALLAGFFVVGVSAQSNPPGAAVPPNSPGYAGDKATSNGEARKQTRDARRGRGAAKPTQPGDQGRTQEGNALAPNRAADNGEMRAETRDARRPGRAAAGQGGTPK